MVPSECTLISFVLLAADHQHRTRSKWINIIKNRLLQEPGRAERAFARYDVATVLKKFFSIEIDDLTAPPGVEIIDFLEARSTPLPWISEEELGQYAEKFQKSGFTGPINYYRMMDT